MNIPQAVSSHLCCASEKCPKNAMFFGGISIVQRRWMIENRPFSSAQPEGPRSRTVCNVTNLPPHIRELIAQGLRGRELVELESLEVKGQSLKIKVTRVPKDLNAILSKPGLLELFTQPPAWAPG